MSAHLKAEIAAICSSLGRFHKGEYLIEPECIESIKDLIRYLKKDDESHEIRRYLGETNVVQNDLIHIIKCCSADEPELFDVTLRLLINLTTPTMLFYGEEIPTEKIGRNIYLTLIGYGQMYKIAFSDVEFWNKICGKLTNLFEIDWTERSANDGIEIERILMLLRNVLQIPADVEYEKRPENDISVHDRVLWALRQSQILELLLFVTSNENEDQYCLNILEIFSCILRGQNPKLLARFDSDLPSEEKNKDTQEMVRAREMEKKKGNKYANQRKFDGTFVIKGIKSFSNNDVIYHKPLDKVDLLELDPNKKRMKVRGDKIPTESEPIERRSTFSVRLFLKEFCLEFLNCGFKNFMSAVKNRLDSGKSLAHDQTYYFWALKFFLDFSVASNMDVNLFKGCLTLESFHFVQTSMENSFEHLLAEKKKTVDWVKRIHLILKAYRSLLETLLWLDSSKNPLVRSISREIKSELFYVVEYREMILYVLLKYDRGKFSISYLRDLVETFHLFVKLLEKHCKETKMVVQKVVKKRKSRKKMKKGEKFQEEGEKTNEEKWDEIKDEVYDTLYSESLFPEIPPFDAALDTDIDDQKGRAMKNIQKHLLEGRIKDGIGLLRSSRQVWPENDYFGCDGMSVEDETMALQEICLANLHPLEDEEEKNDKNKEKENNEENKEEEEEGEGGSDNEQTVEQYFDIVEYKKRFVNKKVVESCGILLKNYRDNSDHVNHCAIKLMHIIGWECCMPAILYQASLFWTLLLIMNDKTRNYDEINTFTVNLMRKFRKHVSLTPIVFLEMLFWKENSIALEIQHGYRAYEDKNKTQKSSKKKRNENFENGPMLDEGKRAKSRRKKKNESREKELDSDSQIIPEKSTKKRKTADKSKMNRNRKKAEKMKKRIFSDGSSEESLRDDDSSATENFGGKHESNRPDNEIDALDDASSSSEKYERTEMSNSKTECGTTVVESSGDGCESTAIKERRNTDREESERMAEIEETIVEKLASPSIKENSPRFQTKKRSREEKESDSTEEDSASDSDVAGDSRSKRFRFVDSDSADSENVESEGEKLICRRKPRNTKIIIDSDSEEERAVDDDDPINK